MFEALFHAVYLDYGPGLVIHNASWSSGSGTAFPPGVRSPQEWQSRDYSAT